MINETCNLHCPYCFASEFVNKATNDISLENFRKAVEFLLTSDGLNGSLGIIGGEPFIHPRFRTILELLMQDRRIKSVVLFTNGTLLCDFIDLLSDPKFKFLINLNSPNDIGKQKYDKIIDNINILIDKGKRNDITLGLNMYSSEKDYSFFLSALELFDFSRARLSITVPNWERETSGFEKFKTIKQTFYTMIIELMVRNISYVVDCNKPPYCIWNDEERKMIELIGASEKKGIHGISLSENKCNPVIDILPDLNAVRCFGLSDVTKVSISDFKSFDDLRNYYATKVDPLYISRPTTAECIHCELFDGRCYGGCLSNKKGCAM